MSGSCCFGGSACCRQVPLYRIPATDDHRQHFTIIIITIIIIVIIIIIIIIKTTTERIMSSYPISFILQLTTTNMTEPISRIRRRIELNNLERDIPNIIWIYLL